MWLKSSSGKLLNTKNFRAFEVRRADATRELPDGRGYTVYRDCPESGYVIVAWVAGGLHFLTPGIEEAQAERVLAAIYSALGDGAKTLDVQVILTGGSY